MVFAGWRWADVNISVKENTIKEVKEETGLQVETIGIDYFDEKNLPELSVEKNTEDQVRMCFRAYEANAWTPLFD